MKVAVRLFQQSPILGHAALAHTVCSFILSMSAFNSRKPSPTGAGARSHCGLAGLEGSAIVTSTNCIVAQGCRRLSGRPASFRWSLIKPVLNAAVTHHATQRIY